MKGILESLKRDIIYIFFHCHYSLFVRMGIDAMKQGSEFTGSHSHSFKLRFNASDGRTVRRAAERKRRKEAKRQAKLEGGK